MKRTIAVPVCSILLLGIVILSVADSAQAQALPNLLTSPNDIMNGAWQLYGSGCTKTNATTFQTNGSGCSLYQTINVVPSTEYNLTMTVGLAAGTPQQVFLHLYTTGYTSLCSNNIVLSSIPVTLTCDAPVPSTPVYYELDTAGAISTITVTGSAMRASEPLQLSKNGQWTTLPYTMPINPIHVALMNNSEVLVVAGSGSDHTNLNWTAALWNPQAGTINIQPVSWDMFCNGMVALPDGRIFVNGGNLQYYPFKGEPKSSIFDLSTNTFTDIENMAHGRWYPTVTTLSDGRIMTFSGLDENGTTNSTVEIYTVGSGWSSAFAAGWTPPLYPRMHLLPSGKLFYSGPSTQSRFLNLSTQTWSNVAVTNYSGTRLYGSSVLMKLSPANNYAPRVLIMGGGSPSTNTTEIIDLSQPSPAWNYGPSMSRPRIEMNAVILPNGQVLAVGGSLWDEDAATASLKADLYNPVTNSFISAGANAYPRLYHSVALLLPDATVWVAGSNPQPGTYEPRMEIYRPPYLFNADGSAAARPTVTVVPASTSYGATFSLSTPDAPSIGSVVLARPGSSTHSFDNDQRLVELSFTLADPGTLNVTAPPNGNIAPPGYYMLFVLNSAGVPSVASFLQLLTQGPDFTITATPISRSVIQGSSAVYTVNVAASGGFNGPVGFSLTGQPSGSTVSFNPSTVTGSGSSALTVSTTATTATGSYPMTITATSGALSHSVGVTLVVNSSTPADFTVTTTPTSTSVTQGSSAVYTVNVAASGGFNGPVGFSLTGQPSGSTVSFNPSTVTGSGSSALTVSTTATTATGSYPMTITATSGALSHSVGVTLVVNSPPDFTLSATPASKSVTQGSSATYTVNVTTIGGFNGPVGFSLTGQPSGSTVSFNPSTVTGSGSSTLTVSTTATTATGSYPMTITATSGALSHTVGVTLVVSSPPDFTLSATPASLTIARQSSGNSTVTVAGLNGFSSVVSLSLKGLPKQTTYSFNPATISGFGSSNLKISVNRPATAGTYGLTIAATGAGITRNANLTLIIP